MTRVAYGLSLSAFHSIGPLIILEEFNKIVLLGIMSDVYLDDLSTRSGNCNETTGINHSGSFAC